MHPFKVLLSGSQPLSKALWGYLILGGVLVLGASSVVGVIVISAFPAARIGVYVSQFVVFWVYLFLASIGTWRSANQTQNGRLRILARGVVVLLAVLFLLASFKPNGVIDMVNGTWKPGTYLQGIVKQ
jgi:hypothetical protein